MKSMTNMTLKQRHYWQVSKCTWTGGFGFPSAALSLQKTECYYLKLCFKDNLKDRDLKECRGACQYSQLHKLRWPLSHFCLHDNLSLSTSSPTLWSTDISPRCHEAWSCGLQHLPEKALSSTCSLKLISLSQMHKAHFDRQMLTSKVNQRTHSGTVTFGFHH